MSKSGTIVFNTIIDNECVHNQNNYRNMNFVVLNDSVMISACNVLTNHHDVRFHANFIDNQTEILHYRLQGDVEKIRPCYIYELYNVVYNFKNNTVLFAGKVRCDLTIYGCPFVYLSWNDFLFSVQFYSKPYINYWRDNTPISFCRCSKYRNDFYAFFTTYQEEKNNFIGMNFETNFDISYSIVGEDNQWSDQKKISKPSNIDPSLYPNFNSIQLFFDEPYFLITGKFTDPSTNVVLLLAGYYLNDSILSGMFVQFPTSVPTSCLPSNCFFSGKDIKRLENGNFVVVGLSHFANSLGVEWLRIIYNKSLQIILIERKPSNNNFIPMGSISLSDGSIVIAGSDLNALALMQVSNIFEKMDEDRFITGENLFINSITSTTSLTFFVGGYTNNFDDSLNYGIILEIGEKLGISNSFQFPFNS